MDNSERQHLSAELSALEVKVIDARGGVWRANPLAVAEIMSSADPEEAAIEMAVEDPSRGEWAQ